MREIKHRTAIRRSLLELFFTVLTFIISLLVLDPLTFLFFGFMSAHETASRRSQHAMVPCIVASDASDDRSL